MDKFNEASRLSTEECAETYGTELGRSFQPLPYQEKLYVSIGNEIPAMTCSGVYSSMEETRERFKERFKEFLEHTGYAMQKCTLVISDDSLITVHDINTLQQLFKKPLTVQDFSTFMGKKEFKKVRKEEPGYRKLEKKQGYKGKVKKGGKVVGRKWYV